MRRRVAATQPSSSHSSLASQKFSLPHSSGPATTGSVHTSPRIPLPNEPVPSKDAAITIKQLWREAKKGAPQDTASLAAIADQLRGASLQPHAAGAALVQLLWALAQCKPAAVEPQFLDFLARLLQRLEAAELGLEGSYPTLSAHAATSALEAVSRLGLRDERLLGPLNTILESKAKVSLIEPRIVVSVLRSLALLERHPQGLLMAMGTNLATPGYLSTLRPPQIGILAHSMASLDWLPSHKALLAVAHATLASNRGLDPADISCVLWMLARRGAASEALLLQFVPVVQRILPASSMRELADVSRAYAVAGVAPGPLFDSVAERAARCVDGARLEDVARVVSAFNQLGLEPEALLKVIEAWAERRLEGLSPNALSLALANFARLGNRTPRLLQTAAACAEKKAAEMNPGELSRVVWAFARLEYAPESGLLTAALHALRTKASAFNDRDAANLLWALARLGHIPTAEELQDVAQGLTQVAGMYSGQSAALVLWALAAFASAGTPLNKRHNELLLQKLAGAVSRDMHALDPQSISMTAWALGTLRVRDTAFAAAVAHECVADSGKLTSFEAQHLANLVWGLVKSGSTPDAALMEAIGEVAAPRLSEFAPQEIFNLCWGFATTRSPPPPLLGSLAAAELAARSSEFGPLELSGMLWALGRLLSPDSNSISSTEALAEALRAAEREVPTRASNMEASQVCMALFGLGRLSHGALAAGKCSEIIETISIHSAVEALGAALLAHLESGNNAVSSASLASAVEGIAWLSFETPAGLKAAIATKAAAAAPTLNTWELCPLAFYLTKIGLTSTARVLLEATRPAVEVKPRGAVLLLAAMHACDVFPTAIFHPVAACLSNMSSSYKLEPHLRQLLDETMHELSIERSRAVASRRRKRPNTSHAADTTTHRG